MSIIRLAILILGMFVSVASISGQETTARVEGVIRDLRGNPISKATVYGFNMREINRSVSRIETTTDQAGRFSFSNVRPSTYSFHAYKESEGYGDTFFSFFATGNKEAFRMVTVSPGETVEVDLKLGPASAKLILSIKDAYGNPTGASLTFIRLDDPERPYRVGVRGESTILVPPIPFRFEIEVKDHDIWRSKELKPKSGERVAITAQLKRSPGNQY